MRISVIISLSFWLKKENYKDVVVGVLNSIYLMSAVQQNINILPNVGKHSLQKLLVAQNFNRVALITTCRDPPHSRVFPQLRQPTFNQKWLRIPTEISWRQRVNGWEILFRLCWPWSLSTEFCFIWNCLGKRSADSVHTISTNSRVTRSWYEPCYKSGELMPVLARILKYLGYWYFS